MNNKILIIMFSMVLLLGTVSAFDVIDFDKDIGDYGKITIEERKWYDPFGWVLEKNIIETELKINTEKCLMDCYSEGVSVLYEDMVLFEDFEFWKGHNRTQEEKVTLNYKVFIKEEQEHIFNRPIMKDVILNNGTVIKEVIGYDEEITTYDKWIKYDFRELSAGVYEWRLEVKKGIKDNIDWIGIIRGNKLTEWAWYDAYDGTFDVYNTSGFDTWTAPGGITNISVLVVAGGGSGGGAQQGVGGAGGGGAGGLVFNNSYAVTPSTTYNIWVGTGGAYTATGAIIGNNGTNSTFDLSISYPGGGGGHGSFDGTGVYGRGYRGASGGGDGSKGGGQGGGADAKYGSQGNDGGTGIASPRTAGGGGGHSAAGGAPNGGAGSSIWGQTFAGGGGGGGETGQGAAGTGGAGGGGDGTIGALDGLNGTDGYGGGGGGAGLSSGGGASTTGGKGGDGIVIIRWISSDLNPIIVQNNPVNNSLQSTNPITFSAIISDGSGGLDNSSFYLNGVLNQTNTSLVNGSAWNISLTLSEGVHNWYYDAWDNASQQTIGSGMRFTLDSTPPVITLKNNYNGTIIVNTDNPHSLTVNVTMFDSIGLSSCWYEFGGSNNSLTCGQNGTISLSPGYNDLIYWANDTAGGQSSNSTTIFYNYVVENITYESTVFEGNNNTVYFNVTATDITSIEANVSYNGTSYILNAVSNNGTNAIFIRDLITPLVSANQVVNISVDYIINSGSRTTGNVSQTIYNIPDFVVSDSCNDKALNFTLRDEVNLTIINGTFEYNFKYGTPDNNTFNHVFGEISDVSSFYGCINSSISNNWSLGEGLIFYTSENYVDRRYYLFEGLTLTNNTNNITLYDLKEADQTSFKLEVETSSLEPYVDKFTTLVRWYPDLNEYNVVDMGLTDEKGSTVIHVRTEDVDYRIGVYEKDGTLIKLADPIRMVCLVSPCTYTLKISPTETDFTSFLNIDYTFDYNKTTGIWMFTFSDSSQKTSTMNLTVYRQTGTSIYPICSSLVTGYSGAMNCNSSAYTGTLKGVVVRSASPGIPLAEKIVTITTSAFSSTFGLWLSMLIAIPIIFIFAFMTPIGAVIGGVVALIPALYFGAINWAVLGGITVLAGIVLHFLRRT